MPIRRLAAFAACLLFTTCASAAVPKIAAGALHAVALRADGTVVAWGDDRFGGQLGQGTPAVTRVPLPVPGLSDVVDVAAAGDYSLALKADGTVWIWGTIKVVLGETRDVRTPSPIEGLAGVVAISAGGDHALALKADGSVWAYGYNTNGQLGDGTTEPRRTAVPVVGLPPVATISAGNIHSLALARDGTLWGWGGRGLVTGTGTVYPSPIARPVQVPIRGVTRAIASGNRLFVVKQDGSVWRWGEGELSALESSEQPIRLPELSNVVEMVATDGGLSFALKADGTVWSFGRWTPGFAAPGDGSVRTRTTYTRVPGLRDVRQLAAGSHAVVLRADGSVLAWGGNGYGQIGDGTGATRLSPVAVREVHGRGTLEGNDWFLDLDPASASDLADRAPPFLVATRKLEGDLRVELRPRAGDVGRQVNFYVFAMAPPSALDVPGNREWTACVLAQADANGQLRPTQPSALAASGSVLLTAEAQALTVRGAEHFTALPGTTYFVGYGTSASAMFSEGTSRSVTSVPGNTPCEPRPPQTGWWWNPAEPGRGYSIEVQGDRMFFGAFLYDVSGRSTWHVAAGPTSLGGSYFSGALWSVANGQTLAGAYDPPDPVVDAGSIALSFESPTRGTLVWPGGTVPIERFDIVPGGLAAAPHPDQPENGWWWNPAESGRGFFIEWQNGSADLVGYMYDEDGKPVWYLSVYETPDPARFSGSWWSYANGQPLVGAWRRFTRVSDNGAPVAITFSGPETATMTLPGGRTTNLTRMRF